MAGPSGVGRCNAIAAMENIALWHERDITHSSVERVIFPDSTILLDYMITTMVTVIKNLKIHKDRMLQNLEGSRGMVFSQGLLLKLIEKGLTREEAYKLVQACAKKVWDDSQTLQQTVLAEPKILKYLNRKEIESVFNYQYHTKHVKDIFKRVNI